MGKIRVAYNVAFKKKAIDLYLNEGISYETVA
ncbi:transposase, partial [Bacillus cereus]